MDYKNKQASISYLRLKILKAIINSKHTYDIGLKIRTILEYTNQTQTPQTYCGF